MRIVHTACVIRFQDTQTRSHGEYQAFGLAPVHVLSFVSSRTIVSIDGGCIVIGTFPAMQSLECMSARRATHLHTKS